MMAQAVAALLVGYLPGALLFRAPIGNRSARAGVAAEERVFWAVLLSATWSVAVVLALAILDEYRFSRLLWTSGTLSAVILVLGRRSLLYRGGAPRVTWTALVPAGLVAFGLWQLLPPAEYVMGGKDPGVYMNEGIQIAQRGGIVYRDPVVASVPSSLRDLFVPKVDNEANTFYGMRFMGYFVQDPDTGSVIGQFPHGYPASIAIGYHLNGLSGARQTVVFWSLLGLVAIYLTGVRVFGHVAAAAGVALLAVNVVEVWWGRYPNVEVASRALLFGSLLAFCRAADGDRRFFGAVAGTLAGLPLFFRYDAILTIGAAVGAAILIVANRQRIGWAFGLTLVATSAAGLWYLLWPMAAYSTPYVLFTTNQGGAVVAVAAVVAVVARAALLRDRIATFTRAALPTTLAIAVVVFAAYAYFYRQPGGRLSVHDAMAFRVFAWYVTPVGLLAAVVGLAVGLRRRFWDAPVVFLTIVMHAGFFFYKTRIVPQHFWTSRRFLTVIVPAAMLAIAALGAWVLDTAVWRRWRRSRHGVTDEVEAPHGWRRAAHALVVGAVLVPLGLTFWRTAAPVRAHVEYAGLIPRLESMAAAVGDRDLLLVESRGTGSDLHVLALPLAYVYDRQVLLLHAITPDTQALADFIRWAPERYDRVLFMGGSGTDLLTRRFTATPIGGDHFRVPEYDSPTNAYPTTVSLKQFDYGLYELALGTEPRAGLIDLDMETVDALLVRGFHTPERHDRTGETFRWTGTASTVRLLDVPATTTEVVIWMSRGGRPLTASTPRAVVSLHGEVIGEATPDDDIRPYRFPVSPALAERVAREADAVGLRIDAPTWNPSQWLGVNDPRDLGVMVKRVQVR